jgi:hypothetical protein
MAAGMRRRIIVHGNAKRLNPREDRRSGRRFPIVLPVTYRVLRVGFTTEINNGETLNISSSGVAFTTRKSLLADTPVELSVDWPAMLDGALPLRLVIRGYVVRTDGDFVALSIESYQFRTRKIPPADVSKLRRSNKPA